MSLRNPSGSCLVLTHLDATFKLSRWGLRRETPPMVIRSMELHQHLIPALRVQQSDGVGHQVLSIAPRSYLLASPCFLRNRPTRLAWSGVELPPYALPAALEGARQPLPAEEETSVISLRPAKTASAHPPSAGGARSPIRSSASGRETPFPLSTPFHTTRSRYRRTNTCKQRRTDQRPPNDQNSYREYSANYPHQLPTTRCHQSRPFSSSQPTTRSLYLGGRPSRSKRLGAKAWG